MLLKSDIIPEASDKKRRRKSEVFTTLGSVALWFVYPNFFNQRATDLQLFERKRVKKSMCPVLSIFASWNMNVKIILQKNIEVNVWDLYVLTISGKFVGFDLRM